MKTRLGTDWTGDAMGASVGELADSLAVLADKLIVTKSKRDAKLASSITTWIDSARASGWWNWHTPLLIVGPIVASDLERIVEVTAGRVRYR